MKGTALPLRSRCLVGGNSPLSFLPPARLGQHRNSLRSNIDAAYPRLPREFYASEPILLWGQGSLLDVCAEKADGERERGPRT
jgi:hypothetical protein